MKQKLNRIFALFAVVGLLSACDSEPTENLQESINVATPEIAGVINPFAQFDPSGGVIPFPNNLLFAGSADGTLNIPVAAADDLSDPQVALNALDGFSTVAPMSASFSTAIDPASVTGDAVKLYQVTLSGPGGAVVAVNGQLVFGQDYFATVSTVDPTGSSLAILPLRPLDEKASYMVVITGALTSTSGTAFGPSIAYRLFKSLADPLVCPLPFDQTTCNLPGALIPNGDPTQLTQDVIDSAETLRQIINVSEATIAGSDAAVSVDDIILGWSFTTQSIGDVLAQVREDIRAGGVPVTNLVAANPGQGPGGSGDANAVDSPGGAADIYEGTLAVPYYLTAAANVNDPAPLASFWTGASGSLLTQFNTSPVATSTQTIPLMVSVPIGTMPAGGWPVVIYQHGITSNRATMLALADALAAEGLAVVAIDLPMHGLTGLDIVDGNIEIDGVTVNLADYRRDGEERTFDLDLVTQDVNGAITAAVPDGIIDSSGRHFVNLTNLLNTRDNLRQAVSDLFTLTYAIQNMSAGTASFDSSQIYFLGHSLGAIVGTTFTALEPEINDAVYAFGGASMAKILDGSAAFGPEIAAGLAANGVTKGSADYEAFLGVAQAVIDTTDPVNHGTALALESGRGMLFFEIVGGASGLPPSDLVVPNTVPDANDTSGTVAAPLAGTEPLLDLMALTQVNASDTGTDLHRSVKFVAGNHSSLLSGAADIFNDEATNTAVRAELQSLTANFLLNGGNDVVVTDATFLQAP